MIDEVLILLRDVVNTHLTASTGLSAGATDLGQVVLPDSQKVDYLDYKLGAISLLMVNLEQEHLTRPGDPFRVTMPDGTTQRVSPPIHLNVSLLFVTRFSDYRQSLRYLSMILGYFQNHRVLDRNSAPGMSDQIEKLTMELLTPPLSELQHLFGMLRTAYQPCLLYRARMVLFMDPDPVAGTPVSTPTLVVQQ